MSGAADSGGLRTQGDVLAEVVRLLQGLGIPYMLTGSLASSVHGEPRTTLDIDLVIDIDTQRVERLVSALERHHYYVDLEAARDAVRRRDQFNAIDQVGGWKVDLIVRKERPFSRAEFDRRQQLQLAEVRADVATAEDTILAKLEWAKRGESERQLRDVAGILRSSGGSLDRDYVLAWVTSLGLEDAWEEALQLAE